MYIAQKYNNQLIEKIKKQFKLKSFTKKVKHAFETHPNKKDVKDLLTIDDIPIKYTSKGFIYSENEHIPFDEVYDIIFRLNELTQSPPMSAEEE